MKSMIDWGYPRVMEMAALSWQQAELALQGLETVQHQKEQATATP